MKLRVPASILVSLNQTDSQSAIVVSRRKCLAGQALLLAFAIGSPVHAQVSSKFDLICRNTGSVELQNGRGLEKRSADPQKTERFQIDLLSRRFCYVGRFENCSQTFPLTYTDNSIVFSPDDKINRRDGSRMSIVKIGDSSTINYYQCERAPFTPFREKKF